MAAAAAVAAAAAAAERLSCKVAEATGRCLQHRHRNRHRRWRRWRRQEQVLPMPDASARPMPGHEETLICHSQ